MAGTYNQPRVIKYTAILTTTLSFLQAQENYVHTGEASRQGKARQGDARQGRTGRVLLELKLSQVWFTSCSGGGKNVEDGEGKEEGSEGHGGGMKEK